MNEPLSSNPGVDLAYLKHVIKNCGSPISLRDALEKAVPEIERLSAENAKLLEHQSREGRHAQRVEIARLRAALERIEARPCGCGCSAHTIAGQALAGAITPKVGALLSRLDLAINPGGLLRGDLLHLLNDARDEIARLERNFASQGVNVEALTNELSETHARVWELQERVRNELETVERLTAKLQYVCGELMKITGDKEGSPIEAYARGAVRIHDRLRAALERIQTIYQLTHVHECARVAIADRAAVNGEGGL